jgi:MinD superfamily P-loop ATPase
MDCDVENPNTNNLLGHPDLTTFETIKITHFVPEFDENKCTKCGKCSQACRTHAIFQIIDQIPILMQNLCNSCELCYRICPDDAIITSQQPLGKIFYKELQIENVSLELIIGELQVGQVQAVKILESMYEKFKKLNDTEPYDYIITDSAPGANCDVEFVLKHSDSVIAVTEPTPFGKHDLQRILRLSEVVNRNPYVIVNRSTISDFQMNQQNVITSIPYDQEIMESYAKGQPFVFYETKDKNSLSKQAIEAIGKFVLNLEVSN